MFRRTVLALSLIFAPCLFLSFQEFWRPMVTGTNEASEAKKRLNSQDKGSGSAARVLDHELSSMADERMPLVVLRRSSALLP